MKADPAGPGLRCSARAAQVEPWPSQPEWGTELKPAPLDCKHSAENHLINCAEEEGGANSCF